MFFLFHSCSLLMQPDISRTPLSKFQSSAFNESVFHLLAGWRRGIASKSRRWRNARTLDWWFSNRLSVLGISLPIHTIQVHLCNSKSPELTSPQMIIEERQRPKITIFHLIWGLVLFSMTWSVQAIWRGNNFGLGMFARQPSRKEHFPEGKEDT